MRIDLEKDYRKILNIPANADSNKILSICSYALENSEDKEIIEAATVLINPQTRKHYDEAREKVFEEQEQADVERKNREADAEKIAEERRRKAERKAARKLEREKRKIAKNIESQKKKIVETYTDDLAANKARESSNKLFKKHGVKAIAALIATSLLIYGACNIDAIQNKIKTVFAKDDEDSNYDYALSTANLSEVKARDLTSEESGIENSYDLTKTFTIPSNEGQVQTRAIAINNYFRANNYHNISNDTIANQIKYINGSYQVSTDGEAYDMQESILITFEEFASSIIHNDTYISGVSENGKNVGLGLDAFISDDCANKEIVVEVSDKFQNLLSAKTSQEQVEYANKFLSLEYELMEGLKQNSNGEVINFELLNSNEGFVIGLMFQLGNNICPSILGENSEISYTKINGEQILINFDTLQAYYNPQYNEELDYENAWAIDCADLIITAEAQKYSYNIN